MSPWRPRSTARFKSAHRTVQRPAPIQTRWWRKFPARTEGTGDVGKPHKAPPPRVRKPSPVHDHLLAPTPDLAGYRARFREAFGNTMSDEFVDVMLGKVIEALKPSPFDKLDEPTLNAALAIIDSVQCRSELEALIAVEIVATLALADDPRVFPPLRIQANFVSDGLCSGKR